MVRAKKGYKRKMRKKTKSNTSDKKKLLASRHLSKNKVKKLKRKKAAVTKRTELPKKLQKPRPIGKYLYCIIKEKIKKVFGIKGMDGRKVHTISYKNLSAVVSDSEIKEFSLTKDNLLTHQKAIEEVMKNYTVLPVAFGIIADDNATIKEKLLKPKYAELLENISGLDNKIVMGLKGLWPDMTIIFQELVNENPEIKKLKEQNGNTILDRDQTIEIGKLVGESLTLKREEEKEQILKTFKEIADDFKENKIFGDQMLFNTVFLVSKRKARLFDQKVKNLDKKYNGRIHFKYIGPIPPFDFVKIPVKLS